MIVRPLEARDLPELLALCAEHAAYEGLPFAESGQLDRWRRALFAEQPVLFGWCCEPAGGGALAGYLTATIDYATWTAQRFVYLDCLFLRPPYRGKGLGRRLMDELRRFAAARACSAIEWQTPPTNALGLRFYRAIGAGELAKVRLNLPVSPPGSQLTALPVAMEVAG